MEYHLNDVPLADVWKNGSGWQPGGRTLIWDDDTRIVWFRQKWQVPDEWEGHALFWEVKVRNGWKLWVDGAEAESVLTESAEPGRVYHMALRGDRGRRPGMIMRTRILAFPAHYHRWSRLSGVPASLVPGRGLLLDDLAQTRRGGWRISRCPRDRPLVLARRQTR